MTTRNKKAFDKQVGGKHYKDMKIQPLEFTLANGLGFIEGNVIKYVSRHKNKNGLQDLEKAKHYIELAIEHYYPAKKVKKIVKPKKAPRVTPNPMMKEWYLSQELQLVVKKDKLTRTEVIKLLWAYIRKNNLQDPRNKRNIKTDALLKPVFGNKDSISMFEMATFINKHLK